MFPPFIFRCGVIRQGFDKFYSVSFQARRSLVRFFVDPSLAWKLTVTNFSFPLWQSLPPPLAFEVGEHQKISIYHSKNLPTANLVFLGNFLKLNIVSLFVFFGEFYLSLDPVIFCGACGAPITRPGGRATLSCPPDPRLPIAKFWQ
jgi:hypothetical protein